jgi:hypothetical protein
MIARALLPIAVVALLSGPAAASSSCFTKAEAGRIFHTTKLCRDGDGCWIHNRKYCEDEPPKTNVITVPPPDFEKWIHGNPEDALRATIRAEVPGLEDTLNVDKLGAAALLVRWAAKESVFGSPPAGREDPQAPSAMPASAIYALYKREEPTFCGGAAVFFMKVLGLFGIEAFIVDSGYSDSQMTHVTTIVPVGSKFYVIDPTFGGTYRTADGAIADLAMLFESPQKVRFSAQPFDRTFVMRPEEADEAHRESPACALREDKALRCQVRYGADQMRELSDELLHEYSFPPGADLIRQFLLRQVFATSADGETERAFLALIERYRSTAARNEER